MESTKGRSLAVFGRRSSPLKVGEDAARRTYEVRVSLARSFLRGNRTSLVTKSEEFVSFRKVLENWQHRLQNRAENLSVWLELELDM